MPESCTGSDPCLDELLALLEDVLNDVLTAEVFSLALYVPIQDGAMNYLLEFSDDGDHTTLRWWSGEFANTHFVTVAQPGTQAGTLDASSGGTLGPGDVTPRLDFTCEIEGDSYPTTLEVPMTKYGTYTVLSAYSEDRLTDGIVGGSFSADDLLGLTEETLYQFLERLGGDLELDVDALVAAIGVEFSLYADMDINADADLEGYSIGTRFDAGAIEVE